MGCWSKRKRVQGEAGGEAVKLMRQRLGEVSARGRGRKGGGNRM